MLWVFAKTGGGEGLGTNFLTQRGSEPGCKAIVELSSPSRVILGSSPLQEVDELYFGRLVLLLVLSIFLVGGVAAVVVLFITEPIHARPHRKTYITS